MASSTISGVSNPVLAKDTRCRYDKFLIMAHKDPSKKLSKENPFLVDKALKDILGRKFYQVKQLNSGHLLIEVDLKMTHDKLLTVKKLRDIPVTVKAHSTLNQCKGKVYCDDMDNMTIDYIKQELKDQHVTEVYRPDKRNGQKVNIHILTFNITTRPKEIRIGYLNLQVKEYIPNPRRCFQCQGYGHGQKHCQRDPICAKCATCDPEHPAFEHCNNEPKCCHCGQAHFASSKDCPLFKLEKEITIKKHRNNLTFPAARDQVFRENPSLVAQVPSIKPRVNKNTYSAAVASPTATPVSQQQQQPNQSLLDTILEQQKQINEMQQLMKKMMDVLTGLNINIPTFKIPSSNENQKSNKTMGHKRSLSETAPPSPDVSKPPKVRDTSSRQEDKNEPASSLQTAMETTPVEGSAAGEVLDLTSQASFVAVPSAPPDQSVTRGARAGSSDPPTGQRGYVSIDIIKKQNSRKFAHVKSKFKDIDKFNH